MVGIKLGSTRTELYSTSDDKYPPRTENRQVTSLAAQRHLTVFMLESLSFSLSSSEPIASTSSAQSSAPAWIDLNCFELPQRY